MEWISRLKRKNLNTYAEQIVKGYNREYEWTTNAISKPLYVFFERVNIFDKREVQ